MQSAKDAREARRRKILERGTDRLAFITGERKFVPTPAEPPADSLDQGDNSARLVNGNASIESHGISSLRFLSFSSLRLREINSEDPFESRS